MSDKEDQTAIELDPEKGATQPLTGGDSQGKVVFTPSSPDGKNEANIEFAGARNMGDGLTKEELMKYANDPTWVRVRNTVFVLYWVIWIAMLGGSVLIIATSKSCP